MMLGLGDLWALRLTSCCQGLYLALKTLDLGTHGSIASNHSDVIRLKLCKVLLKLRWGAIVSRLDSRKLVPLRPRFVKFGVQFQDSVNLL